MRTRTGFHADQACRLDTEIRLRAEEDGAVVVEQEMQRNMERADSVRFRLDSIIIGQDSDGDDRTIVRVVELDGNPAPKPAGARKGRARELETALQTVLHRADELTAVWVPDAAHACSPLHSPSQFRVPARPDAPPVPEPYIVVIRIR